MSFGELASYRVRYTPGPMTTQASQEELDSLKERLTWRDSDLVFSTHGRNMTREHMRGVGSEFIALVLQAGDGAVLRSFESLDGKLFQVSAAAAE
jgi:hypothetical protein